MNKWKLEGLDTFEFESYPIPGEYDTQIDAERAALERKVELEKLQPTESSGGQDFGGVQDRIFIIRPDGSKYRYLGGTPLSN